MRITESLLRRIIREEILNESPPLLDLAIYDKNSIYPGRKAPSIGHPRMRSRRPQYRGGGYERIAKELMEDTEDNWVIVTLPDFRGASELVKTEEFKKWLGSKYKPGTRVVVVAGTPVERDYKTPGWQIVHDIFGHSIEHEWNRYKRDQRAGETTIDKVTRALHSALPKHLQLAKASGSDFIPDILGSILLQKFDREAAMQVVESLIADKEETEKPYYEKLYTNIAMSLFESVDVWLMNNTDENGVTIAMPF
jgi:hypothetical protein